MKTAFIVVQSFLGVPVIELVTEDEAKAWAKFHELTIEHEAIIEEDVLHCVHKDDYITINGQHYFTHTDDWDLYLFEEPVK